MAKPMMVASRKLTEKTDVVSRARDMMRFLSGKSRMLF
jgi:hypothetical protein